MVLGEYKSLAILSPSGAAYFDGTTGTWKNAYTQIQNPNPDLKWESTAQWNLGVDFSVFNKLNGTLELYYKKTSDLLWTYPVPQPPYLVGTMLANVGDLVNKGFELSLGYKAVRAKNWTLDANMSLAYNHQEITKLSNDQYQAVGLQAGSLHTYVVCLIPIHRLLRRAILQVHSGVLIALVYQVMVSICLIKMIMER